MVKSGSLCLGLLFSFAVMAAAVVVSPNAASGTEDILVCYKVKKDFRGNPQRTQLAVQNDDIGGDGTVEVKTNKAQFVCSPADLGVLNGDAAGASESESAGN